MEEYLNEKEKRVIASLYKLEDRSVSQLAKSTLINRTSLYPILNKLMEKGLVSAVSQEEKTLYDPIEPEAFKAWLKNKKEAAIKASSNLETWLDQTTTANKPTSLVSRIKYYEGVEGVKTLCADSLRNEEKMICGIVDFQAAADSMEDYLRNEYIPARVKKGIRVKDIVTEGDLSREEQKTTSQVLRQMKLAKGLFEQLGIEIMIYDKKTAIISYDKDNPCGLIIENEKITSAMKNIFQYIWNGIEEPSLVSDSQSVG